MTKLADIRRMWEAEAPGTTFPVSGWFYQPIRNATAARHFEALLRVAEAAERAGCVCGAGSIDDPDDQHSEVCLGLIRALAALGGE